LIPSGEVIKVLLVPTATNNPFPYATAVAVLGAVRAVQLIPSGDVMTYGESPSPTATKSPFPYVTDFHFDFGGPYSIFQLIPTVEVS
jgi:hypothetical protein